MGENFTVGRVEDGRGSLGPVFAGSLPITRASPSSEACQKSGPFALAALPGLNAPTTLSLPQWSSPKATLGRYPPRQRVSPTDREPPFRRAVLLSRRIERVRVSIASHSLASSPKGGS